MDLEMVLLAIATIVGILIARQIFPRIGDGPRAIKPERLAHLAAPFVAVVAVSVAFFIMNHGEQIFHASINEFGLHLTQILVSVAIVGIGVTAYFFKRWNQGLYGLMEMVFAATTVFGLARTLTPQKLLLGQWATFAGFAYVVSRGWGNVWDYRETLQPNKDGIHRTTAEAEHR